MKDSLVLHTEHFEQIEVLNMEQRGILLTAIMSYQVGGEIPEMDAVTKMCFMFIRQRIDRDNESYQARCKKNADNVRKRWEPKEEKADTIVYDRISEDTNVYERIPTDTKGNARIISYSDNDPDNDTDNDKRKKGTTSPKKEAAKPQGAEIEEMGFSPDLEQAVKDWTAYKTEKRQGYKPTGFKSLLTRIKAEEGKHGSKAVVDAIQEAMANGWQGIVWERIGARSPNDRPRTTRFVNYDQRKVDYDAMLREGDWR